MDKVEPMCPGAQGKVQKKSTFAALKGRVFPNLKKLDLYGEPVKLHFSGQESYKTSVGGVCSIMQMLTVAVVTLLAIRRISSTQHSNISNFYQHVDENQESFDPFSIGLQVYFGLKSTNASVSLGAVDPKMGQFSVKYVEKERGQKKSSEVSFAPCKDLNLTQKKVSDDFFYCIEKGGAFDIEGDY